MAKQQAVYMSAEDYHYQSRRFKKRTFAVLNQNTHVRLKKHGVYMITTTGLPVDEIAPYTLTTDITDTEIDKIAAKLTHDNYSELYKTIRGNIHYGLMGVDPSYRHTNVIVFESFKDQDLWLRHESHFTLFYSLARLDSHHIKHVAYKNYGINLFGLLNRMSNFKVIHRRSRKRKRVGMF